MPDHLRHCRRFDCTTAVSAALAALLWIAAPVLAGGQDVKPPYVVRDGRVDASTYLGWRVYQARCASCHGSAATGTRDAPNLLPRVALMSPSQFQGIVLARYKLVSTRGSLSHAQERDRKGEISMPEWGSDPAVKPHVLDLYAYLRARADGVLDARPPVPLP